MSLAPATFARWVGVPARRVRALVRGKRGITPDTAWLLAGAFGTTPEFWMNLQGQHDLAKNRPTTKVKRIATG